MPATTGSQGIVTKSWIVYRVLKQLNAVAKITGLISNVTHRLNCSPGK
ncbi:MAG: hypothetical protein KJ936_06235 [Proteobacteria bacterium]|nr:hypothetical protein [Pseudomonadota bacterium]MBU2227252.1 hypothetical protein [Pseudomonadota bacterium]